MPFAEDEKFLLVFTGGIRAPLDGGQWRQIEDDTPPPLFANTTNFRAVIRLAVAGYCDRRVVTLHDCGIFSRYEPQ
jgi:hypothetical protein